MRSHARSISRFHTLSVLLSARPRQTVLLCFAVVFAITLVLAGRQYWLGFERQINDRQHRLQLLVVALDAGFNSGKHQLLFLRRTAERVLAEEEDAGASADMDETLRQALQARKDPVWGLQVPDIDASVRSIGERRLAGIPGFTPDPVILAQDLKLARVMSPILAVQYQASPRLAHAFFISTSGLIVTYPAIGDEKLEPVLRAFAASRMMQSDTGPVVDFDVAFNSVRSLDILSSQRLVLSTPVLLNGIIRGGVYFDVPQQSLQDDLYAATSPDELHALLDMRGTLIASNEETFTHKEGNWLKTLPVQLPRLSLPAMFQTKTGALHDGGDYFLYRELPQAGLMLVSHIPAQVLRWSVVSQFSTVFIGIWISLGVLLAVTLLIVDYLLKSQLALNAKLRELGLVDTLTQLANRRRLQADFKGLLRRFKGEQPIALLLIDLDRFKYVNDNWGHPAGDEVLKHLATVCRALVRPQDLVARYGGEEFCILLPATDLGQATAMAEKLREGIAQSICLPDAATMLASAPADEIRVTVSIGVAEVITDQATNLEELLAKADRRLYAAKQGGRNRVVADDAVPSTAQ